MDKAYIILIITGILNVTGALAAWLTKLWWTNEFSEAKKAQIDVLEAHIRTLTSAKDEALKIKESEIQQIVKANDKLLEAKDVYIDLLKTQIQQLNEQNPVKLREIYLHAKAGLEDGINFLQSELAVAQNRNALLQLEIEKIKEKDGRGNALAIKKIEEERESFSKRETELTTNIEKLEQAERLLSQMTGIVASTLSVDAEEASKITKELLEMMGNEVSQLKK